MIPASPRVGGQGGLIWLSRKRGKEVDIHLSPSDPDRWSFRSLINRDRESSSPPRPSTTETGPAPPRPDRPPECFDFASFSLSFRGE